MGFSIIKEIESNKETKSKPWQQWSQYARVSPIEKPWFYNPNHIQQKEITIPSIIIKKKKRLIEISKRKRKNLSIDKR